MLLTLTRIRLAEVVAWRTEFLLWLMTLTMPLIMLVFWRAVARDGAFNGYTAADFSGYFLAVLVAALVTECNVVWNLNEDIRTGELSFWLIKPVHPAIHYVAITLAELPARLLIAAPILGAALWISPGPTPALERLVTAVLALAGGLMINQALQIIVGSLGFWIDRSLMVHRLQEAVSSLLSGYMFPIAFLPQEIRDVAAFLPFRFIVSLPVEFITGRHDLASAVRLLSVQAIVCLLLNGLALFVWQRGVRRYAAYG